MKASTLFAIVIALLLGLGAAAGARYAGLFKEKAPPPPEAARPAIKVLVPVTTLYEDTAVTSNFLKVRDLRPEERQDYEVNKDRYLPANPHAAHLLIANRTIPADRPLQRADFKDAVLPDSVPQRLAPGMRGVNLAVEKDRAGGGTIRVGDYVDVFLTTIVKPPGNAPGALRTACLARACKVIMKRNNPWPVVTPLPDDKPVHFTLQANPYRAALVEHAQQVGEISLIPIPAPTRKSDSAPFSDPTSREYADEDSRVDALTRGDLVVGTADLERVFDLPEPTIPPV